MRQSFDKVMEKNPICYFYSVAYIQKRKKRLTRIKVVDHTANKPVYIGCSGNNSLHDGSI